MEKEKVISTVDNLLCRRWTVRLLALLAEDKRRFGELLEELDGISSKTLTERLKRFERENIVKRKEYPEIPPRVEYSLTEKGKELVRSFDCILDWAEDWFQMRNK